MKPEEKDAFAEMIESMMAARGQHFGDDRTAKAIKGYWWTLEDEDFRDVKQAIKEAMRELRTCPNDYDLLELCREYRAIRRNRAERIQRDKEWEDAANQPPGPNWPHLLGALMRDGKPLPREGEEFDRWVAEREAEWAAEQKNGTDNAADN